MSLRGSSSILADPAISIGATWADNGTIYFIKTFASGIYAIPAGGGEATQVTHTGTKPDDRVHLWPSVLPRNSGLIFTVWSGKSFNEARIEGISFKTGKRKVLLENGTDAHYLSSGHIAYGRDGTLFIAGFDPDRMEVKSSPTLVSTSTQGTFLMSPKTLTQNPLDDRAGMPVNNGFDLARVIFAPGDNHVLVKRTLSPVDERSSLIALTFERAHVAPASVLRVRARVTALISLQQMTQAIGAAARVARINRLASRG